MTAVAVVDSGSYDLEIETGFDFGSFTLGDSVRGVLNNTEFPLGPGTDWASVITGTTEIRVLRGRRNLGDQFVPGSLSAVLSDTAADGVFNPFDTSSPYYDPATAQPGLAPMRKIRLSRITGGVPEYLFVGLIVTYDYTFTLGGLDQVNVYATDNAYTLAQTQIAEWNVDTELASTRVANLLDLPEINAFTGVGERSIETSITTLGGSASYTVADGTNALQYLSEIQTAEQGRIFVDREGQFVFQRRVGTTLSGPALILNDTGGTPYDAVGISFESDQVVNRVSVATKDHPHIVAEDLASQAKYFIQSQTYETILSTEAQAETLAEYLLVGEPTAIFTNVSVSFPRLSDAERDTAALVEIGDTIDVEKQIQTSAGPISFAQELSVEGIEHSLTLCGGHTITYYTTPTVVVYELVLDSIQYGTIDELNVLG
jgi:hypothetical protein